MPTYVTRIVVTQVDNYEPPAHDITGVPGSQVWIGEWTKTTGPLFDLRSVQPSIVAARRLTANLLKQRPPGKSADEVLTLIGFDATK
jgi:hypothetical protein